MALILLCDDEPSIRDMLETHLTLAGHSCLCAADAQEAHELLAAKSPDVALLDVMMPGEDGFSLGKSLAAQGVPVLFLTAKTAVADRVYGLRLGAEDYILKPFEPAELLARIDVILRRTQGGVYRDQRLALDEKARSIQLHGKAITLTALEFDLLALLVRRRDTALTREALLSQVWGYDYVGETRTVDVHIQRLRQKIGADAIETVYKFGYRYKEQL